MGSIIQSLALGFGAYLISLAFRRGVDWDKVYALYEARRTLRERRKEWPWCNGHPVASTEPTCKPREEMHRYTYNQLTERREIRPFEGLLHWDSKEYLAVSYTWGSSASYFKVEFSGNQFLEITKAAFTVLDTLLNKGETMHMWIDGLCINQSDNIEKSRQVRLMDEIYAKAQQVVICLGEPTADNDRAMDFILPLRNAIRAARLAHEDQNLASAESIMNCEGSILPSHHGLQQMDVIEYEALQNGAIVGLWGCYTGSQERLAYLGVFTNTNIKIRRSSTPTILETENPPVSMIDTKICETPIAIGRHGSFTTRLVLDQPFKAVQASILTTTTEYRYQGQVTDLLSYPACGEYPTLIGYWTGPGGRYDFASDEKITGITFDCSPSRWKNPKRHSLSQVTKVVLKTTTGSHTWGAGSCCPRNTICQDQGLQDIGWEFNAIYDRIKLSYIIIAMLRELHTPTLRML